MANLAIIDILPNKLFSYFNLQVFSVYILL